jgi:hypothetical protein
MGLTQKMVLPPAQSPLLPAFLFPALLFRTCFCISNHNFYLTVIASPECSGRSNLTISPQIIQNYTEFYSTLCPVPSALRSPPSALSPLLPAPCYFLSLTSTSTGLSVSFRLDASFSSSFFFSGYLGVEFLNSMFEI